MLQFNCPACNKRYETDDGYAGGQLICDRCGTHFFIPELEEGTIDSRRLIYNSQVISNGALDSRPIYGLKYILNPSSEGSFKVIPNQKCTLNVSKYVDLELKN